MTMQYPISNFTKADMRLGTEYKMLEADNITYIYLGSTSNENSLARITWRTSGVHSLMTGLKTL